MENVGIQLFEKDYDVIRLAYRVNKESMSTDPNVELMNYELVI